MEDEPLAASCSDAGTRREARFGCGAAFKRCKPRDGSIDDLWQLLAQRIISELTQPALARRRSPQQGKIIGENGQPGAVGLTRRFCTLQEQRRTQAGGQMRRYFRQKGSFGKSEICAIAFAMEAH